MSEPPAVKRPAGEGSLASALPEFAWPPFPGDAAASMLALVYQLEETQWWPARRLLARQLEQAAALVEHARRNVPFYRTRLPASDRRMTWKAWRRIPVTSRAELQHAGESLFARSLPPGHAPVQPVRTSGSTGRPLATLTSAPASALGVAINLRGLLWHEVDFSARAASIRRVTEHEPGPAPGSWGACFESGAHVVGDVRRSVGDQVEWLIAERPRYLLTYPTMLDAIARHCEERGLTLDFIDRLSSFGEVLDPAVRERCRRVLGLEIIDSYSAQETGVLTSQCPERGAQHVASEAVLLEVLDESGRACRPGRVGRVVVTCLANFASPLIRYDIGDYAEAGGACACGRGLPVIARIAGRLRNMLLLPDGTRRWPFSSTLEFAANDAIRQFQVVQKSAETLEARLVVSRPLGGAEQEAFVKALVRALRHPFRVELRFLDAIARGAGGKYEDFLCEVPLPD